MSVAHKVYVGGATPAARLVREVLESVAAPDVIARVLHRALHLSQEPEIPSGGSKLHTFVSRHLRSAMGFVIDEDTAQMVTQQLLLMAGGLPSLNPKGHSGPALVLDDDDINTESSITKRRELTTGAPPLTYEAGRIDTLRPGWQPRRVLVATHDQSLFATVDEALGGTAKVSCISDIVSLLEALDECRADGTPTIVLMRARGSSIQPSTLATVSADFPTGSIVVAWGFPGNIVRDSMPLVVDEEAWVALGPDVTDEQVIDTLHEWVDPPISGVHVRYD